MTEPNAAPSPAWVPISNVLQRLDWSAVFGNNHPVEIDLGAGDGSFIAACAAAAPERNFLAVERLLGRARKIARKADRRHLPNLKVLRLESAYTIRYLVPPGSVSVVYLLFPDPWPKRRQQHNRIVQPEFVQSIVDALEPGGEFRFKTDHAEYFSFAASVIDANPHLKPCPFVADALPRTDFENEFISEGRSFWEKHWKKL